MEEIIDEPGPVECPHCKGQKSFPVHYDIVDANGRRRGKWGKKNCSLCSGVGAVLPDKAKKYRDRKAEGERIRADRVRRGMNAKQEAARLSITIAELIGRERGFEEGWKP